MAGRMTLTDRHPRPILIVDDDRDILAAERAVLAEYGFAVREAHDGAEALLAMDEDPPAMIVLDVQMPGIDGPTFARALRARLRHVPLVILTGAPDPKREADRCNAEAFLRKPFDAADLLRLVRRFST
jgi:CheY-like chemotaxis protein